MEEILRKAYEVYPDRKRENYQTEKEYREEQYRVEDKRRSYIQGAKDFYSTPN